MLILNDTRNPYASKSSRVSNYNMYVRDDRMHEIRYQVAKLILFVVDSLKIYLVFY
jgi:hypothetical protein